MHAVAEREERLVGIENHGRLGIVSQGHGGCVIHPSLRFANTPVVITQDGYTISRQVVGDDQEWFMHKDRLITIFRS